MKPVLHFLTIAYLTVKSIKFKSKKENKSKMTNLPNATEAFLGVGFAGGSELDSLPKKAAGIVFLH